MHPGVLLTARRHVDLVRHASSLCSSRAACAVITHTS
ncbi:MULTISPECIES: putative leader peptide [unclassified Streptomyces]